MKPFVLRNKFNLILLLRELKFTLLILSFFSLDYYYASGEENNNAPFLNLAEGVPCGNTDYSTKARILGGEVADVGEFPFLASVQKEGVHFCGAFLIKKNFLVSASHCFIDSMFGSKAYKDYEVLIGTNDWTERNASNIFRISNVLIHPNYSYLKPNVENDIALITLDREVEWSSKVQPICLANEKLGKFEHGIIGGWGIRAEKENINDWMKDTFLHKVTLPIWSNTACQSLYMRHRVNWNMRETHLCAGYQDKEQDTSSGDSGSPITVISNGRRIAYGIVSVGEGSSLPGIYTRISAFTEWIIQNAP